MFPVHLGCPVISHNGVFSFVKARKHHRLYTLPEKSEILPKFQKNPAHEQVKAQTHHLAEKEKTTQTDNSTFASSKPPLDPYGKEQSYYRRDKPINAQDL